MKFDFHNKDKTSELNFVGVNFKENIALSKRYEEYLTQSVETEPQSLLSLFPDCVVVATSGGGDPLDALSRLCQRIGFARCSGRMFAGSFVTEGLDQFLLEIQDILPQKSRVRVHCYPPKYTTQLLDQLDLSQSLRSREVLITPTNPTHLLVSLLIDGSVCWGLYTEEEYRGTIARPGDGDRYHIFDMNFNKAQSKIAEALQLLTTEEQAFLFNEELLVVDVGAAPGGWTAYLASLPKVAVVAVDPAVLDPEVLDLHNIRHLRLKAEEVLRGHSAEQTFADQQRRLTDDRQRSNAESCQKRRSPLEDSARDIYGENWKTKFRLLTCDANLDVRDSVRELVLPVTEALVPGGIVIITLKLGRRVGEEGVIRKVNAVTELLVGSGFDPTTLRTAWLFSNSKNERTVIARKK